MPVRKSSRPLLEVSMWPLNIRFLRELEPDQRATTLARPSSIACQVKFRPSCCREARIYCAICSYSPVGLGMLMTSQAMETSSSSRTQERIFSANFASSVDFDSDFFAVVVTIRSFYAPAPARAKRKSSGYEQSFSLPLPVIQKLSSRRNPPPPGQ